MTNSVLTKYLLEQVHMATDSFFYILSVYSNTDVICIAILKLILLIPQQTLHQYHNFLFNSVSILYTHFVLNFIKTDK